MAPTAAPTSPPPATAGTRFATAEEWLGSLGGVPLRRVLFDPAPGTATEGDLLRCVEGNGRARRLVELVSNTLVEKPVRQIESLLARVLSTRLGQFIDDHGLGDVYGADCPIRMSTANVRLPDVSFVERRTSGRRLTLEKVLSTWPDLVVEMLSESNTKREMELKRREYFDSGTRLVWEIDWRTRGVEVYTNPDRPDTTLTAGDVLTGGDVVPGFTMPLADLFAKLRGGSSSGD